MTGSTDARLGIVSESIRVIPHFPKQGIMFQDVTTLLLKPDAFQHSIDLLYEHFKDSKVDVIAGKYPTLTTIDALKLLLIPW